MLLQPNLSYLPNRKLNRLANLEAYGEKTVNLGDGAHGLVYQRGEVVVKQMLKKNLETAEREITFLLNLCHPNVVTILDVFTTKRKINVVLEKADRTLLSYIEDEQRMSQRFIKIMGYQLIRAVAYCHSNGIIHRDVKPENILVHDGDLLKLADFGISRSVFSVNVNIPVVTPINFHLTTPITTINYRAPELLLGSEEYSYAIDTWSIGCTLAEMLDGYSPFFDGRDEECTLKDIFLQLGSPTEETWPDFTSMPEYTTDLIDPVSRDPAIQGEMYDIPLIRSLLTFNPATRISALTALNDSYFDEIRTEVETKYPAPVIYIPKCDEILLLRCETLKPVKMKDINGRNRRNMLNWLHDIGMMLKIQTRTYYLAVHYSDKYLSLTPDLKFKKYKAICVCALSLACDLEEIYPPDLDDFSCLTNNAYTPEELSSLKRLIWFKLDFNLLVTLPYDLALAYGRLTDVNFVLSKNFNETLFKIILCHERSGYTTESSLLARANAADLAKACLLFTYKSDPNLIQSLEITHEHQLLAEHISKLLPTLVHTKCSL